MDREDIEIWNSEWLESKSFDKELVSSKRIFQEDIFNKMDKVIKDDEVEIFMYFSD